MKLTSDQPYWLQRNGMVSTYDALRADVTCECVVIGAGVTGAMLSDRLARDGFDVIVVDRNEVCTGSTSASTALLLYDIDVPLVKLAELIGWDKALRAYQLSYNSIDAIEELALGLRSTLTFVEIEASTWLSTIAALRRFAGSSKPGNQPACRLTITRSENCEIILDCADQPRSVRCRLPVAIPFDSLERCCNEPRSMGHACLTAHRLFALAFITTRFG